MLYTTTTAFLRCFGLGSIEDLPDISEGDTTLLNSLKEMSGEKDIEAINDNSAIND